jgi:hypothetical protein
MKDSRKRANVYVFAKNGLSSGNSGVCAIARVEMDDAIISD